VFCWRLAEGPPRLSSGRGLRVEQLAQPKTTVHYCWRNGVGQPCELTQGTGWHVAAVLSRPTEQGTGSLLDFQGLLRRQQELLSMRVDDDDQDLEARTAVEETLLLRELQPQPL
jgi:hypothetical protein